MSRFEVSDNSGSINTTLGELVTAITEVALKAGQSEAEGYQLASLTVERVLRRNRARSLSRRIRARVMQ